MLGGCDAYVNLTGGMRLGEPAVDLGVVMAIVSSYKNRAMDPNTLIFGEVGLTGEIRGVSFADKRVNEARKLGFSHCILPMANLEVLPKRDRENMDLIGVRTVSEALKLL